MTAIAQKLDRVLQELDEENARVLETLVNEAIAKVRPEQPTNAPPSDVRLSPKFFAATAGAFADEPFERPPQGEQEVREQW